MLATGTANTLLTKYQDHVCVDNCDDPDPEKRRHFEQPVIQTLQMFIGEMGCWLVLGIFQLQKMFADYRRRKGGYEPVSDSGEGLRRSSTESRDEDGNPVVKALVPNHGPGTPKLSGTRILLLALPACCDIAGTTLMNVGLLFVVASIYQMTRGALVLFVGLFSVIFLKRKLHFYHWLALFIVVLGVAIVGLAGTLSKESAHPTTIGAVISNAKASPAVRTMIGVFLIAFAQVFTATQFVLEEYILEAYSLEPLKVVGWEGIFGFTVTIIGMVILHYTVGVTEAGRHGYFDMTEGWRQVRDHPAILRTSIWIMISIGGFNFFGISVTRSISATSRSIIDTCRTLFIWMISLALGWERFKALQVVGFAGLVYGTFLFNGIVKPPLKRWTVEEEREELLPEEPVEHI